MDEKGSETKVIRREYYDTKQICPYKVNSGSFNRYKSQKLGLSEQYNSNKVNCDGFNGHKFQKLCQSLHE